jgi:enoyl-CoA hydratase
MIADQMQKSRATQDMNVSETPPLSVLTESQGPICILTLNRPHKKNAADLEMQERLLACLKSVAADATVRVLILTGAGGAFSAGGDREYLRQIAAGQLEQQAALAKVHSATIRCMLRLSIPVIAAVSGPAVGYAAGLVAMCDMVVMGDTGFLSDPHVKFGIAANTATQLIWPRLTSSILAREILMSGRQVGAVEAVRIGLANRHCPAGAELATALDLAQMFTALPSAGISGTKRAFNEALIQDAEKVLRGSGAA